MSMVKDFSMTTKSFIDSAQVCNSAQVILYLQFLLNENMLLDSAGSHKHDLSSDVWRSLLPIKYVLFMQV